MIVWAIRIDETIGLVRRDGTIMWMRDRVYDTLVIGIRQYKYLNETPTSEGIINWEKVQISDEHEKELMTEKLLILKGFI